MRRTKDFLRRNKLETSWQTRTKSKTSQLETSSFRSTLVYIQLKHHLYPTTPNTVKSANQRHETLEGKVVQWRRHRPYKPATTHPRNKKCKLESDTTNQTETRTRVWNKQPPNDEPPLSAGKKPPDPWEGRSRRDPKNEPATILQTQEMKERRTKTKRQTEEEIWSEKPAIGVGKGEETTKRRKGRQSLVVQPKKRRAHHWPSRSTSWLEWFGLWEERGGGGVNFCCKNISSLTIQKSNIKQNECFTHKPWQLCVYTCQFIKCLPEIICFYL